MKKILTILIFLSLAIFSCRNDDECVDEQIPIPHEEQFFEASVAMVTTSANSCDKILSIILDIDNPVQEERGILAKDLEFNYDAYEIREKFELRFTYLPDSFYCHISGPIVGGDRDKVFPYIEVLEVRELDD